MNLKVNVTLAGSTLNGYMNVDPLANPQDPNKIACDITNLDPIIDHNSVDTFLA